MVTYTTVHCPKASWDQKNCVLFHRERESEIDISEGFVQNARREKEYCIQKKKGKGNLLLELRDTGKKRKKRHVWIQKSPIVLRVPRVI